MVAVPPHEFVTPSTLKVADTGDVGTLLAAGGRHTVCIIQREREGIRELYRG